MRTGRSLTVCCSLLPGGGGWGSPWSRRGVLPARGGSPCWRGVLPAGGSPWSWGGSPWSRGGSPCQGGGLPGPGGFSLVWGGVCLVQVGVLLGLGGVLPAGGVGGLPGLGGSPCWGILPGPRGGLPGPGGFSLVPGVCVSAWSRGGGSPETPSPPLCTESQTGVKT